MTPEVREALKQPLSWLQAGCIAAGVSAMFASICGPWLAFGMWEADKSVRIVVCAVWLPLMLACPAVAGVLLHYGWTMDERLRLGRRQFERDVWVVLGCGVVPLALGLASLLTFALDAGRSLGIGSLFFLMLAGVGMVPTPLAVLLRMRLRQIAAGGDEWG